MKIIVEKTYEDMSRVAANLLLAEMYQEQRVNMAITAGSTPVKMYEYLIPEVKDKPYFDNVHYYNFDEIPVKDEKFGVTMNNLNQLYFLPANIKNERIHVLDETNFQQQDQRIAADGGLDLILLGIGADGHYCGNLPGTTKFEDQTSQVSVNATPSMRDVLISEVGGVAEKCPDFYVTMGPKSVMNSRKIVLFASGEKKAAIIKKAFFGQVTNDVPASILQLHPNITLVLDEAAASEMMN